MLVLATRWPPAESRVVREEAAGALVESVADVRVSNAMAMFAEGDRSRAGLNPKRVPNRRADIARVWPDGTQSEPRKLRM
jgi:hypothetical protein